MKRPTFCLILLSALIFSAPTFVNAAEQPKIAVYVTGDLSASERLVLGEVMLNTLVKSGRFVSTEFSAALAAEIEKESMRIGEAEDRGWISRLGEQFGFRYICIVEVATAFGTHRISASILDAETAGTRLTGTAVGQLDNIQALESLTAAIVNNMLGEQAAPVPTPEPEPVAHTPTPEPEPVVHTSTPVHTSESAPKPASASPKGPFNVSVYVTGVNTMIGNALSKAINTALVKSGVYPKIESIDQHMSGAVSDNSISQAAKKAGVGYVFVVNAAAPMSVRIIDAETAAVMAQVSIDGQVTAMNAAGTAKKIVDFILASGPKPDPATQAAGGAGTYGYAAGAKSGRQWPRHSVGYLTNFSFGERGGLGHENDKTTHMEFYLRRGLGETTRLYVGFGTWMTEGKVRVGEIGVMKFEGRESQYPVFIEWYTSGDRASIYGGLGIVFGLYDYKYYDGYGNLVHRVDDEQGIDCGAQGGVQFRWSRFVCGADMRLMYYTRFYETGTKVGLNANFGVNAGVAFGKFKTPNNERAKW